MSCPLMGKKRITFKTVYCSFSTFDHVFLPPYTKPYLAGQIQRIKANPCLANAYDFYEILNFCEKSGMEKRKKGGENVTFR